jgi:molybdopterin-guanine dinucleotide biosynthesis protein A
MQRDKAALVYRGQTQLERAMALLETRLGTAFVSMRRDQAGDPLRSRYRPIFDLQDGLGPIGGIMAAQAAHPDVAWLVLACDLPYVDAVLIEHLLQGRAADHQATAYRSSYDGLPEPLCAIYEPCSREPIAAYVAGGGRCPRRFLQQASAVLIDPPAEHALDNVNTQEEYAATMKDLSDARQDAREIKVQYYALLREQAGRSEEQLSTAARTPRELFEELRARHRFSLGQQHLRVAVNERFADWSQPLCEGDSVVFIPPVAGG